MTKFKVPTWDANAIGDNACKEAFKHKHNTSRIKKAKTKTSDSLNKQLNSDKKILPLNPSVNKKANKNSPQIAQNKKQSQFKNKQSFGGQNQQNKKIVSSPLQQKPFNKPKLKKKFNSEKNNNNNESLTNNSAAKNKKMKRKLELNESLNNSGIKNKKRKLKQNSSTENFNNKSKISPEFNSSSSLNVKKKKFNKNNDFAKKNKFQTETNSQDGVKNRKNKFQLQNDFSNAGVNNRKKNFQKETNSQDVFTNAGVKNKKKKFQSETNAQDHFTNEGVKNRKKKFLSETNLQDDFPNVGVKNRNKKFQKDANSQDEFTKKKKFQIETNSQDDFPNTGVKTRKKKLQKETNSQEITNTGVKNENGKSVQDDFINGDIFNSAGIKSKKKKITLTAPSMVKSKKNKKLKVKSEEITVKQMEDNGTFSELSKRLVRMNKMKEKIKQALEVNNMHEKSSKVKWQNLPLRERMMEKLKSARFRYLNEEIYTNASKDAVQLFKTDPSAFTAYHEGYRQQVARWPMNPLDSIIIKIKKMAKTLIIADFGCGEGRLAESVSQKVHSFDIVAANNNVTACDMANVPLENNSVDVVVFCLSLMGTNLIDYLYEANRVLKIGGVLIIAEVESRFDTVETFIAGVEKVGFKNAWKDLSHNLFYFLDFKKVTDLKNKKKLPTISLHPCLYKKR